MPPNNHSTGNETKPNGFHLGHRPGLDGFRGIAILLVVLVHLEILPAQAGFIGVDIFFVLSGFLITSLLVLEWDQSNRVSLKSFYCRRALRLLPALMVMLAVFVGYEYVASPLKPATRNLGYAFQALFYFTNWSMIFNLGERSNFLFNHTWSLSIEEQFYLIWPPLLLFMLWKLKNRASVLWFTVLAALLSALLRVALVVLGETSFWRFSCGLDTRADSLLIGCCAGIAIASGLLPKQRRLEIAFQIAAVVSALGLLALSFFYIYDARMYVVGWFLTSLFAGFIITHLVYAPQGLWHRVLGNRPLAYAGKISYGLYLWHYPVFHVIKNLHSNRWQYIALPAALAATLASYYLIELPCLRLKKRFEKAK